MANADLRFRLQHGPKRLNRSLSLEAENKALQGEIDWRQRQKANARSVGRAWSGVLACLPWELFVTLTFDDSKVPDVSEQLASREAFDWCNGASRIYRRPLGWVFAPETGKTGRWHVHVLIIGVPNALGEPSRLPEACGVWKARNGFIDMQCVHDLRGVTLYSTKQAAAAGTLVWSDTLGRYRDALQPKPTMSLCPDDGS